MYMYMLLANPSLQFNFGLLASLAMSTEEADIKTPLTQSAQGVPSEPVDYDAIFEAGGKPQHRTEFAQETIIGECRNPKRVSWVEWTFMIVATLSMISVLGVTIERLVTFESDFVNITNNISNETAPCNTWVCTNDFIFAWVLLVNLGFCAFYCYDGLLRERPFEILAYAVAVTVIVIYIIINFIVKGDEGLWLRTARLVLVCIFGPVNVVLALWSWWKMGYFVLNVIGTNTKLIRAYRFRSFFQTVQLFNVEVLCNILVLAWFGNGELLELWEKIVLPLLLVFTIVVTLIGGTAVLWELRVLAYVWYALILPCGLYYLYKLIEVSVHFETRYQQYSEYIEYTHDLDPAPIDTRFTSSVLLFACIFGFLVVVLLVICMTLTLLNFGKGLKEKIHPPLRRYIRTN